MSALKSGVVFICCLIVGGTFIAAGALKSLDVDGFARDIALHGILGAGPSAILARALIPFEIVFGAGAILGWRRRVMLGGLICALVLFIGATGWAWSQGNTEGCGCFGQYAARTPLAVIVEDIGLLAAALLGLALGGRPSRSDPPARLSWRPAVLGVLAVASTAFALASPYLPIDDFATALRPGVALEDLGLTQIAGNLGEGDRLLVILVLDETASQKAVPLLNALALEAYVPPITGLTSATEEERFAFFLAHAPTFDILEVPSADLRRLYRRAPRSLRVHNGAVLEVWRGVPSGQELTR